MMVMRTAVQVALEWAALQPSTNTYGIVGLLDALAEAKGLNRIGGITASFLMGGTRLPAMTATADQVDRGDAALRPYTALTGQQAVLSDGTSALQWILASWSGITLKNAAGKVVGNTQVIRTAVAPLMPAEPFPFTVVDGPRTLPARRQVTLAYALAQRQVWDSPNLGGTVFDAGPNPDDQLVFRSFPRELLEVLDGGGLEGGDARPEWPDGTALANASWVTLVPLRVRRTANPNILELLDGAGPDRTRLLDLWQELAADEAFQVSLRLLHTEDREGVRVFASARVYAPEADRLVLAIGRADRTVPGRLGYAAAPFTANHPGPAAWQSVKRQPPEPLRRHSWTAPEHPSDHPCESQYRKIRMIPTVDLDHRTD